MPLLATDHALGRHSYYAATVGPHPQWPSLEGDQACDVAIVGGGLAGLSAALDLRRLGLDVVLLEAREIGSGASGRNGGQAIHGLACEQGVIEEQLGEAAARQVWDLSIQALDLLRQRINEHGIECEWRDGFIGVATSVGKGRALMRWAERTEQHYGYALRRIPPNELREWVDSPRYHCGIHDPRSGHLHPLKYTLGLARAAAAGGVRLHEHSPVTALVPGEAPLLHTATGAVRARQVLLAGNVYLQALVPALQARIMPVGTYIACSEVLPEALVRSLVPSGSAVCDTNFVLDYFRPTADRRLLYGGRVSYSTRTPSDVAGSLQRRWLQTFPQLRGWRVAYSWGGFVDITMNRAPDFGRLPPSRPGGPQNIYYLQGFSGHGLALSGLAGRLVAEAMGGDTSRMDVFSRLRHHRFPGGPRWRTPALVLGMAWYRLRDMLG